MGFFPTHTEAQIKGVRGIAPAAAAAGVTNGPAIDRLGFQSGVLLVDAGAVTGAPSAQTLDAKIQDSADGAAGWTDVPGLAIQQITAPDIQRELSLDLTGTRRFIRVVQTVAFTGGTTPTLLASAAVVLGGAVNKPA